MPPPQGGALPGPGDKNPQQWQEAYLDLEQEKRKAQSELRERTEEATELAREVETLRGLIEEEKTRRKEKVADLARQLETLERDNKQLQMRLMKVQMQDSAKLTDVTTVKKEVVAKTMELEKLLREFQQTHQEKLFTRVRSVTGAMLSVCQKPDVSLQISTPAASAEDLLPVAPLAITGPSGGPGPGSSAGPAGAEDPPSGTFLDPETQEALKRRLQSLGDVVVYTSNNFEACCASGRIITPGALRVRPRRCDHVFLIECLMPYWAEGLCPVCRSSFAYDRPREMAFEESDRYSSVSTSVSQRQSPALPRPPLPSSSFGGSASEGGLLRGPRGLRVNGVMREEQRGRSTSTSRASRRRRSMPAGMDTRSDVSEGARRVSSVGARDRQSVSPPRSAVSMPSRSSSVPRDRSPHASIITPSRPL